MPCLCPLHGYRAKKPNESGKYPIVFNRADGFQDQRVTLKCKKCIGCRLEYSRQWAIRCTHEAQLYQDNCFITLTYDNDNLPSDNSVHLDHFQKFMKRLRKKNEPTKIRFFHCAEYGDLNRRPHYHALLFNYDFPDKTHYKTTGQGHRLYTSEILDQTWNKGRCDIGSVSFDSAAYVARYVMKKFNNAKHPDEVTKHYTWENEDGTTSLHKPEYLSMSTSDGIGHDWFLKYYQDCYPKDFITVLGVKSPIPEYYDELLKKYHPFLYDEIKDQRIYNGNPADNTDERLLSRIICKEAAVTNLTRQ